VSPNAQQSLAIVSPEPRKVIVAGPGSGKSFVLVQAVKARLAAGVDPRRIACVTFTNGAAHILTQRLGVKLGHCGTLHSFGFRLIQKHGDLLGYIPGSVSILPPDECRKLLFDIRDELGAKKLTDGVLLSGKRDNPEAARVWDEYWFRLKMSNLADYDKILEDAFSIIELVDTLNIDELYVDEVQDSAEIDWKIYNRIPVGRKFFVGDPDQSVFAFRGAQPAMFVEAAKMAGQVKGIAALITLETNYRSDIAICRAASNLISHNQERIPKAVVPHSTLPGEIHVDRYESDQDEWFAVAGKVARWLHEGASVAVLVRTNYLADQCRLILTTLNLNWKGDKRILMPSDWQKALTLVSLCVSPGNDLLAEKYLGFSKTATEVRRMKLEAQAREVPLIDAFDFIHNDHLLNARDLLKLPTFLAQSGISENAVALIRARIELLGFDATLSDLLSDLYSHRDWNSAPEDDDKTVHVGTMHGAKGTEHDVVFLPAFEEGIIPSAQGTTILPDLEEERRLAFVAVTRARHQLYLSSAVLRKPKWGAVQEMQPSRFIAEMSS
jgi:DNA helicase-2/ATP-dependent DNA helicase PcrA